jgi:hypothetical protein
MPSHGRRQSQRRDLTRLVLVTVLTTSNGAAAHESRPLPSWLIFDVRQTIMSFDVPPPDPKMIQSRLAFARARGAFDVRVHMSWLEAVAPLVTAKAMAVRAIGDVMVLAMVAELFGEPDLIRRSRLLIAALGAHLKKFNSASWVRMDLSEHAIAAATAKVEELIPRLSELREERPIFAIHQDARELYMRVAVNSQVSMSAKKGLFAFMSPKTEVRQDLARFMESLKSAELEVSRAAQAAAAGDATKN